MAVSTSRRALVMVSAAAVSTAVLAGCGSKPADTRTDAAPNTTAAAAAASATDTPGASPSATATPSPTASPGDTGSPSPTASKSARPSPTATPSTTKPGATKPSAGSADKGFAQAAPVVAAPAPTAKPGPVAPPPPPAPATPHVPPLQSGCQPSKPQPDEPKEAVGAALASAAGQPRTLSLSNGGTDKLPPLPVNLVKAIAWQESGWQSGILACDGGIGTMQIMPNTVSWMHNKFGTDSDPKTLAGNVQLGTQLLDWLVAYFGDSSFGGKYDLSPDAATGRTPLLDLVISAYNAGAGNVHYNTVTDPATGQTVGSLVIPNPSYVANVKALMSSQPWNKAG
ncbi:transglycosylase SLT domain-containing protein [Streptomyces kaniharaensis]|uniref:Transglycosylase SLT domain-containing protein n=1 Tax=Streptomyces kaniharaensis TaxID=212423 RepID=A0A6N7KWK8_9ACTN|nr:lytic transglycosylase domain-containing protein [Streptomyces kaniharaensis]MQS14999.1 transglycosylase SLT domain-containing protein [Streptomyces kaniharaensis]